MLSFDLPIQTFAKYWFVGAATSTALRVYYNGVYATFLNMFKLSALGLGWGKTPVPMQVLCLIGNLTFAYYHVLYAPNPPAMQSNRRNNERRHRLAAIDGVRARVSMAG